MGVVLSFLFPPPLSPPLSPLPSPLPAPCVCVCVRVTDGQVTGVEAKHCRNHNEQATVVREHIRLLRQRPEFNRCPIVFVPENMTGFFESRMQEYIATLNDAYTFCQHGAEERPGVRKDAAVTRQYVIHTHDYLSQRRLLIDQEWVSSTAPQYNNGREGLLSELKTQLARYGYDEKGKLTGKYEHNLNDDLCIAFMMLMHWMTVAENATAASPYAKYRFPRPLERSGRDRLL